MASNSSSVYSSQSRNNDEDDSDKNSFGNLTYRFGKSHVFTSTDPVSLLPSNELYATINSTLSKESETFHLQQLYESARLEDAQSSSFDVSLTNLPASPSIQHHKESRSEICDDATDLNKKTGIMVKHPKNSEANGPKGNVSFNLPKIECESSDQTTADSTKEIPVLDLKSRPFIDASQLLDVIVSDRESLNGYGSLFEYDGDQPVPSTEANRSASFARHVLNEPLSEQNIHLQQLLTKDSRIKKKQKPTFNKHLPGRKFRFAQPVSVPEDGTEQHLGTTEDENLASPQLKSSATYSENQYELVTGNTELNCFKEGGIITKGSGSTLSLPSSFSLAKGAHVSHLRLMLKTKKEYQAAVAVLGGIVIMLFCIFLPLIISTRKGSSESVLDYFKSLPNAEKSSLLDSLLTKYANLTTWKQSSANPTKLEELPTAKYTGVTGSQTLFESIPLKYQKDPEVSALMNMPGLQNAFYGVAYSPRDVIEPLCGATPREVLLDVALLSQITPRIRTYGMQCNQNRMILNAIKELNANLTLSMGVWIGSSDEVNKKQLLEMKKLLTEYPRSMFDSIMVGNEVLFREDKSVDELIGIIDGVKNLLHKELDLDIPVGVSELGSKSNSELFDKVDLFGSNTHPFFSGETVQAATNWVYDFLQWNVDPHNERSDGDKRTKIVITEVGWPYKGGQFHKAVAGPKHFQHFLNSFVCKAKEIDIPWFYFEAFDEPWKKIYHVEGSKWETEWGLFTHDRKMKNGISFPQC